MNTLKIKIGEFWCRVEALDRHGYMVRDPLWYICDHMRTGKNRRRAPLILVMEHRVRDKRRGHECR